jgi:hypothetical protein
VLSHRQFRGAESTGLRPLKDLTNSRCSLDLAHYACKNLIVDTALCARVLCVFCDTIQYAVTYGVLYMVSLCTAKERGRLRPARAPSRLSTTRGVGDGTWPADG